MRISVITPALPPSTSRNSSLMSVVKCCNTLLTKGDQHIIVADDDDIAGVVLGGEHQTLLLKKKSRDSTWGNVQRDFGAMFATGDCIVYCDDDDVLVPEGIDFLHEAPADSEQCYLFRMRGNDTDYGTAHHNRYGWIGGPQIVPPNRDDLPKWCMVNERGADFYFIRECAKKYKLVERPEYICYIRPR